MRYRNEHHYPKSHYQQQQHPASYSFDSPLSTTISSSKETKNHQLQLNIDTYGVGDVVVLQQQTPQVVFAAAAPEVLVVGQQQHTTRRMDHPDNKSGPDSHRKRSAASSLRQQQQQQQDPNTISAPRRRALAQERYLAAVGGGGGSSTSSQPPTPQQQQLGGGGGSSANYQSQRQQSQPQPQHHHLLNQPPPPSYSVATSSSLGHPQQQPPPPYGNTMPPGTVAAAYATDPYLHRSPPQQQQQQSLLFQQQQQAAPAYGRLAVGQPPPQQYPYYAQQAAPRQPPPQQQLQPTTQPYAVAAAVAYHEDPQQAAAAAAVVVAAAPPLGRLPSERPLIKLSVSLIETYKHINTVYYEERDARRKALRAADPAGGAASSSKKGGANNNGWDDDNYDYIITPNEIILGRYKIKERIGKGSFGQVVRAEDLETKREVAIKIIKSKKPFLMQAKTEIELLTHLWEKDVDDQHNIVRLLTHFMYRNHQCLVFEMLSLNLYELLKNTQFGGVSLNLIRKFAKQVLRALAFLARPDVDVIHCDLKPENILLRHPKKSGVKVIDFGSSCRSNKRMYSYIQSRFYRSPEVMLGLPYSVAIDMWSLGCILVEMHTGEPLFSGSDQFDQMQKIVKILGMLPYAMLDQSTDAVRCQFFDRKKGQREWTLRQTKPEGSKDKGEKQPAQPQEIIAPSTDPIGSLTEVITSGAQQKKKYPPSEAHNSQRNYELFVDLVYKMLAYNPEERIKPLEALDHAFLTEATTSSVRH